MASSRVRGLLPRNLRRGDPVLQFFLNGFGRATRYTFVNFPSLYAPGAGRACIYDLVLYDSAGAVAGHASIEVPIAGTAEIALTDVMKGPLPELGVVSAQIRSSKRLDYGDRHLGTVRSFFYAAYHDHGMSSVSVVHPQTAAYSSMPDRPAWRSNMLLWPSRVRSFELLLMNPTPFEARTDLRLVGPDGVVAAASAAVLPPRGARRVRWESAPLQQYAYLNAAADMLAAPNAKPLVFLHFDAGAFSAAHS
ncbi:MAG: hypothetical protein ACR2MQ_09770 [Gemmatimonadaceae bacterium]